MPRCTPTVPACRRLQQRRQHARHLRQRAARRDGHLRTRHRRRADPPGAAPGRRLQRHPGNGRQRLPRWSSTPTSPRATASSTSPSATSPTSTTPRGTRPIRRCRPSRTTRPTEYCTSVTAYVTAMKAVDPTIKIVGPDLAYKYQAGGGTNDWDADPQDLRRSIRRHLDPPLSVRATMATLPAAQADPVAVPPGDDLGAGDPAADRAGGKPLALTEMNVAYDATACVLGARRGRWGRRCGWPTSSARLSSSSSGPRRCGTSATRMTGRWASSGCRPGASRAPNTTPIGLYAEHFGPTVLAAPAGLPSGPPREPDTARRRDGDHPRQPELDAGGAHAAGHRARATARGADLSLPGDVTGGGGDHRHEQVDRLGLRRGPATGGGRAANHGAGDGARGEPRWRCRRERRRWPGRGGRTAPSTAPLRPARPPRS